MPNSAFLSEKDMLKHVADGSDEAFKQLFTLYHHQLGTYIYRLTDSMELAEEVVQDVFLKIWMSRETLTGIENFKAYLFVISKNHALNCLRKLARERSYYNEWDDNVVNAISSENDKYEPYYSILDEAINNLPTQQKTVYLLSRHQRLKYAEIAERLNLSKETVKKYLQIAIASITNYVHANIDLYLCFFTILLVS